MLSTSKSAVEVTPLLWRDRADAAWSGLLSAFRISGTDVFRDAVGPGSDDRPASLWSVGALLAAAGALALLPSGLDLIGPQERTLRAALTAYARPRRLGYASTMARPGQPAGDAYYDDNAWVGLAALDLATVFPAWQPVARAVDQFLDQGFDPRSGGVFWKERPRQSLHVCSTGPALVLSARLAESAPDAGRMRRWRAMLDWLLTMQAPDGRFWDNRRTDTGAVDRALHTYNTGTPLEALATLRRWDLPTEAPARRALDGVAHFLDDAGELPPTPWFNAVLLRGLIAVRDTFGWESPATAALARALNRAADRWESQGGVLLVHPTPAGSPVGLRQAAAAVEILARLAARPGD